MAPSKPGRLEFLRLESFRGATQSTDFVFDVSKPVIMIFGENGSGKSAVVDALDFVCNKSTDFLSGRKSTPVLDCLPALGSKPAAVRVELGWGGERWVGQLQGAVPKIDGPREPPRVRILRRSQLLQVVGAQPGKRYEELRNFIAVPGVEQSELALREELQSVKEDLERTASTKADAESHLRALWEKEGSPGTDPFTWARTQAASDESTLQATKAGASAASSVLSRFERSIGESTTAETSIASLQANLEAATRTVAAAEVSSAAADAALVELLDKAGAYLETHPGIPDCPVCEQTVDSAALRARIAQRREATVALAAAIQARRALEQTLRVKREAYETARAGAANDCRGAITTLELHAAALDGQLPPWKEFTPLADASAVAKESAVELTRRFASFAPELRVAAESLRDQALAQLSRLGAIRLHHETQERLAAHLIELSQRRSRVQAALSIVEDCRKRYVDEVLVAISHRVNDLYAAIHPDEGLGQISLRVEPKRRASLALGAQFHGAVDVPPEGYYSESHQDTLGLCVFLALAEYYDADADIMVVDDILTSSDQAHLDRIIALLHEKIERPQLVITTHYRPWRDRYRYARGPAARVQLIELLPWSLAAGIRHTKTKLEVEELEAQLTRVPIDRQAIASKAGVLLEATLEYLAARYECEVTYRPAGNHPLGDFFRGLGGKLRKLLVVKAGGGVEPGATTQEVGPVITELEEMAWMRDLQGAHFNLRGLDIGDAQIQHFGQRVAGLVRILVCADCGELPRRSTGASWDCHCGRTSLSPLAAPGRQPKRDDN